MPTPVGALCHEPELASGQVFELGRIKTSIRSPYAFGEGQGYEYEAGY